MAAKRKRQLKPRPYGGNRYTASGKQGFIISSLRKARWPPKFDALRDSQVGRKINAKTGKMAMHHKCAQCGAELPTKDVAVDHIIPVTPVIGFDSFDAVILRLFCEALSLQVLCKEPCHATKTREENEARREHKKNHGA